MFYAAQEIARTRLMCFCNCDIVCCRSFAGVRECAAGTNGPDVGRRGHGRSGAVDFGDANWGAGLKEWRTSGSAAAGMFSRLFRVSARILRADAGASDRTGVVGPLAGVESARGGRGGGDVSEVVTAIHQNHDMRITRLSGRRVDDEQGEGELQTCGWPMALAHD